MKTIAKNKKAYHDYFIEEKIEAGLVLRGSEVKALRAGHASLADGYALIRDGVALLINFQIPQLKQASFLNHNERRDKQLLLKQKEISRLNEATRQKGYTVVPLEVYFNDKNMVKILLGLAKGKAQHDKRDSAKQADAERQIQRAVRR